MCEIFSDLPLAFIQQLRIFIALVKENWDLFMRHTHTFRTEGRIKRLRVDTLHDARCTWRSQQSSELPVIKRGNQF